MLRLSIPEGTQLRHFRSGTKVVFDFARNAQAAAAREAKPEPAVKPAALPAQPTANLPATNAEEPAEPAIKAEEPAEPAAKAAEPAKPAIKAEEPPSQPPRR